MLNATEEALDSIFDEGRNPPNLRRVTTNKAWREGKTACGGECRENWDDERPVQCPKCAVTVSQTKIGICLQFEWLWETKKRFYTSVDLIPTFPIIPIEAMELARLVNRGAIQ